MRKLRMRKLYAFRNEEMFQVRIAKEWRDGELAIGNERKKVDG